MLYVVLRGVLSPKTRLRLIYPRSQSLETLPASPRDNFVAHSLLALLTWLNSIVTGFIPEHCQRDPDQARRARLIAHFGFQGAVFGAIYAIFYAAIDHRHGAMVVVVCSIIFAAVPWILRRTGSLGFTGHLVVGTMTAGFTQLTLIEGGIHSHAVSWLASVPLCALLILGVRPAAVWAILCFLVGTGIGLATLWGVELAPLYDIRWHTVIDAAGNLGIIIFLFILGLVFESSRATAFHRMENSLSKLAASNEELAHLNNEKTEFLGIAAHDLRNPLTAIIGFSDLLLMEPDPQIAETGGIIAKAGRRMLELITDLLDANAIEEGRYAADLEPLDFRNLIATSQQHNALSSERKQSTVVLAKSTPCFVQADRKATLQVLDNLISNALKYSPPASEVRIVLQHLGGWIDCAVIDRGPGISDEDQQKLFRKHTRLSARPTAGESSIGLGLSIVKKLAEAMGGEVRCESRLGSGSSFILRLRAVPAELLAVPPR